MADDKLFTVKKFDGTNFNSWSDNLRNVLAIKDSDLWKYIANPVPVDATGAMTATVAEKAAKAMAYIYLSCDDMAQKELTAGGFTNPHDAYKHLETTYKAQLGMRVCHLETEWNQMAKMPKESIDDFCTRVLVLKMQLKDVGIDKTEVTVVNTVLNGLPRAYSMLKTVILNQDLSLMTLANVKPRLMMRELELGANERGDAKAFAAHAGGKTEGKTHKPYGKKKGGKPAGKGGKRTCYVCDQEGHFAKDCPKKQALMAGSGAVATTSKGAGSGMKSAHAMMGRTEPGEEEYFTGAPDVFYMDSGANKHMSPYQHIFSTLKPMREEQYVKWGRKGSASKVEGVGTVEFYTEVHGREECILLKDVLYVPGAACNLFSIRAAEKNGQVITMKDGKCNVYTRDGFHVIEAEADEEDTGLYVAKVTTYMGSKSTPITSCLGDGLDSEFVKPSRSVDMWSLGHVMWENAMNGNKYVDLSFFGKHQAPETAELWHRRLGHVGGKKLARLVEEELVDGINVSADALKATGRISECDACAQGKMTRPPFPTSTSTTTRPLELVHTDVSGRIGTKSLGKAEYWVTLRDDYSGFSLVETLRNKSDAYEFVKSSINWLESQTGHKLKALRSDRGGEYVNLALEELYAERGITAQTTAPYTPQQNGVAERYNRTLAERVRAMLTDAGAPREMWGEAVVAANYLNNLVPADGKAKTPWELMFGQKPSVKHLRTWGCVAHVMVPKELRSKLDRVSIPGILVGYEAHTKAYRILADGCIKISRDVVFDELGSSKTAVEQPVVLPEGSKRGGTQDFNEAPDSETTPDQALAPAPVAPVEEEHAHEELFEDAQEEEENEGDILMGVPEGNIIAAVPDPPAQPQLRVSNRANKGQKGKPYWQAGDKDYITNTGMFGTFSADLDKEPASFEEAKRRPDYYRWRQAMEEEIDSLMKHGTYTLERLPKGAKKLKTKWVYKLKRGAEGKIERYKARLVAKGYMQREGVDFDEVFAPTSKHTTLRMLLAFVAAEDLELHQLDVKTAFLHGELKEEIWMEQPPGFEQMGPEFACRLNKALYGLRQAPREWHARLKKELEQAGYEASDADPALFIKKTVPPSFLVVWVDDVTMASKSIEEIKKVKKALANVFEITDLGEAKFFLGMELERDRAAGTLKLSQKRMIEDLLVKYGMEDCKIRSTPLPPGVQLTKEGKLLEDSCYSELVGSLLYLSTCTRPDLSQAVGALSRFMAKPTEEHWTYAKGVLRYLAGTRGMGIVYGTDKEFKVHGYCDADFAGDIDKRRSTTGYVFVLHGGAISWSSRLQPTVAASTTEAEYMAAASAVKEALALRKLLWSFGVSVDNMEIWSDNQASISLMKNPISSMRSKHIDVIHHFARERVERGEVSFTYISTDKMLADIMTKPLPVGKFIACRAGMGMQ